jgi:hypothetical protein
VIDDERETIVVLNETGSDQPHVIAEEVAAWQNFVLRKATPPGFVTFGWGLTWLLRRVLLIRRLLPCDGGVKRRW